MPLDNLKQRIAGKFSDVLNSVDRAGKGWKQGINEAIDGDAASVFQARDRYKEELDNDRQTGLGYAAGRAVGDWTTDGSRGHWWRWNNLGAAAGMGAQALAQKVGIDPSDKKTMALVAAIASVPLVSTSGNFDYTNIDEFGRAKGFKAVFPDEEDPRKTTNPVGEVVARYVLGQKGDILPQKMFLEERPDLTALDQRQYREFQRDRGLGGFGVLKYTNDGINNSPEISFLGMNAPVDAIGTTALAIGGMGAYLKGKEMLANHLASNKLNRSLARVG